MGRSKASPQEQEEKQQQETRAATTRTTSARTRTTPTTEATETGRATAPKKGTTIRLAFNKAGCDATTINKDTRPGPHGRLAKMFFYEYCFSPCLFLYFPP